MNALSIIVIISGLAVMALVWMWVWRKDQEANRLEQLTPKRTPAEWEQKLGIRLHDFKVWDWEKVPVDRPISRDQFIRFANISGYTKV